MSDSLYGNENPVLFCFSINPLVEHRSEQGFVPVARTIFRITIAAIANTIGYTLPLFILIQSTPILISVIFGSKLYKDCVFDEECVERYLSKKTFLKNMFEKKLPVGFVEGRDHLQGSACLSMAIGFVDPVYFAPEDIFKQMGRPDSGLQLLTDLARVAEREGYTAKVVPVGINNLSYLTDAGDVLIIPMENDFFSPSTADMLLVTGYQREVMSNNKLVGRVVVHDPQFGPDYALPNAMIRQGWGNSCMNLGLIVRK